MKDDDDDDDEDSGGGCWAQPYLIVSSPLPETMSTTIESSIVAWQMENKAVHGYGTLECRMGSKMGHIHLTVRPIRKKN
jgi:hypothetical protein